jgi:hypothetical protein
MLDSISFPGDNLSLALNQAVTNKPVIPYSYRPIAMRLSPQLSGDRSVDDNGGCQP